jgi:sugar lactone lactonase YvrE
MNTTARKISPKLMLMTAFYIVFACSCSKDQSVTPTPVAKVAVATFYGSKGENFANYPLANAQFDQPGGVAFDAAGNIYIADQFNEVIRKITADGQISIYAGTGTLGNVDGNAASAQFYYPTRLAFDAAGNLYVVEQGLGDIRKITPAGVVSTLIKSGKDYVGITTDNSGNIYVTPRNSNEIDKITPAGVLTIYAGSATPGLQNGSALMARFFEPYGIVFDSSGNLYVADGANEIIRKITPAGTVSTFAGSGTMAYRDGTGTLASFESPSAMTIDHTGNLYIVDYQTIRKITPGGAVFTIAGNSNDAVDQPQINGPALATTLGSLNGIAVDPSGNIYFTTNNPFPIGKISFQ